MKKILEYFKKKGGYVRLKQLREAGFHPRDVSNLVKDGKLERIKPGLYRLYSIAINGGEHFTKVDVCKAYPQGIICLLSALDIHALTTFNPHEIYVAFPRDMKPVKIEYPPVKLIHFTNRLHQLGVITIKQPEGIIRVYDPEKTICDMFRYRNKLGHDVAMEALKTYMARQKPDIGKLLEYAAACRVKKIIFPYLEALTRQ